MDYFNNVLYDLSGGICENPAIQNGDSILN